MAWLLTAPIIKRVKKMKRKHKRLTFVGIALLLLAAAAALILTAFEENIVFFLVQQIFWPKNQPPIGACA
jgi:cytochrome c-type biogenesis protein CcmE